MDLALTLDAVEFDNIWSWVLFYRANPHLIGVSGKGAQTPPPAGWKPEWQTRIVLENQSAARFYQIAAQMDAEWARRNGAPPPPPPAGDPYAVPEGTFGAVIVADPMFAHEQELVKDITAAHLFALPCVLPAGPWTHSRRLDMQSCEFQNGPPTTHQVCFSRAAGDFSTMTTTGAEGNQPTAHIDDLVAAGFKPGEKVYLNLRFWSRDIKGITATSDVQRVRFGGHWPS